MNDFRADLHCHTTCSDGSETPTQVIQLAKKLGLTGLSITDHDSIEAYATAIPLCIQENIALLIGAEFSATHNGHSVHILGYGFDLKNNSIAELISRHTQRRENRNNLMLKKLEEIGLPLSYDELMAAVPSNSIKVRNTVGRPHIALAMIKKGYVTSVQEAFNKYLGEGRPCYIQGSAITVEETIAAIHEAYGIAVIAHPHLIKNSELIHDLLRHKFDGIECYYGNFPSNDHQRWLKIATKNNLLITGGSDFHGTVKPNINLGCSWIDQPLFQKILDRLKELHHA